MRSVFISFILVLISCAATLAQTNQFSPCPKIDITESVENFDSDGTVTYTADVSSEIDKYFVEYKWTVKDGKIVEGQGSKIIKVKQSSPFGITAFLEIEGLPKNCSNTASYTLICRLPPEARKTDEFSISASRIAKERLDELIKDLQNDPNALAQIIERFSFQTSQKIIEQKNRKIIDYLKTKGIERNQFKLLNASSDKNLTEFFIAPVGASPPTCSECIIVQP
ncbi:MAG: hypothetical protein ACR2HG_06865 [Pyrinomonadaceae bacterium]